MLPQTPIHSRSHNALALPHAPTLAQKQQRDTGAHSRSHCARARAHIAHIKKQRLSLLTFARRHSRHAHSHSYMLTLIMLTRRRSSRPQADALTLTLAPRRSSSSSSSSSSRDTRARSRSQSPRSHCSATLTLTVLTRRSPTGGVHAHNAHAHNALTQTLMTLHARTRTLSRRRSHCSHISRHTCCLSLTCVLLPKAGFEGKNSSIAEKCDPSHLLIFHKAVEKKDASFLLR
jgi:hypothetical protein